MFSQDFKGAIFDLDGTLLDSMWVWQRVDEIFLHARGFAVPDDYSQAILALTFRETAEYTIKRFGLCDTPEQLMDEWNQLSEEQYSNHVKLKPGVRGYLKHLRACGIKLGVATALTTHVMQAVLSNNDVLHLFDALTSADEVVRGKTHPDIYLLAAQKLGIDPRDCIVFEDVHKTLRGIRAAGMKACAVWDESCVEWDKMVHAFDYHVLSFAQLLTDIANGTRDG